MRRTSRNLVQHQGIAGLTSRTDRPESVATAMSLVIRAWRLHSTPSFHSCHRVTQSEAWDR